MTVVRAKEAVKCDLACLISGLSVFFGWNDDVGRSTKIRIVSI